MQAEVCDSTQQFIWQKFSCFVQFLKNDTSEGTLPIKKAACVVGLQPCGKMWVLGEATQVSSAS